MKRASRIMELAIDVQKHKALGDHSLLSLHILTEIDSQAMNLSNWQAGSVEHFRCRYRIGKDTLYTPPR